MFFFLLLLWWVDLCGTWESCWAGWLTVTLLPSASRHSRGTHYVNCRRDFFILCCDDMSDWCIQWSIRGVKVYRHRSAGFSWWWGPHWVCTFFDLLSWMNDTWLYLHLYFFFYFCTKTTLFLHSSCSCASTCYPRVEVGTVDFSF